MDLWKFGKRHADTSHTRAHACAPAIENGLRKAQLVGLMPQPVSAFTVSGVSGPAPYARTGGKGGGLVWRVGLVT
ncbi:unnamed protein product [Lampetra planeri]